MYFSYLLVNHWCVVVYWCIYPASLDLTNELQKDNKYVKPISQHGCLWFYCFFLLLLLFFDGAKASMPWIRNLCLNTFFYLRGHSLLFHRMKIKCLPSNYLLFIKFSLLLFLIILLPTKTNPKTHHKYWSSRSGIISYVTNISLFYL